MRRAVRAKQNAISAGLANGLHHVLIQASQNMLSFNRIAADESLNILENRILAEKIANDLGYVCVNSLVVGDACAECICEAHVSGPVRAQQTRHAERRIRSECEW